MPPISSVDSDDNEDCVGEVEKLGDVRLAGLQYRQSGETYHSKYDPEVIPSWVTR